ncbi:MAG: hypothetical protein ACJ8IR_02065 [Alphaproteobacteria bacterium]|jgi:hypothetical protein
MQTATVESTAQIRYLNANSAYMAGFRHATALNGYAPPVAQAEEIRRSYNSGFSLGEIVIQRAGRLTPAAGTIGMHE